MIAMLQRWLRRLLFAGAGIILDDNPEIVAFLNGKSVARVAADVHPGAHGPIVVEWQRDLEAAIRDHVTALEEMIMERDEVIEEQARAIRSLELSLANATGEVGGGWLESLFGWLWS